MSPPIARHAEKLGLAGSLVVAFIVAASTGLPGAPDPDCRDAAAVCGLVQARLESGEKARPGRPAFPAPALDAWRRTPRPGPAPDWAAYRMPETRVGPPPPPESRHVLGAVTLADPEPQAGRVVLAWALPPDSTAEGVVFDLERRPVPPPARKPLPEPPWIRLATDLRGPRFEDTDVAPRATYEYRLRARTADPRVDAPREGAFTAPARVRAAGVFKLLFQGGMPDLPRILVRKWTPAGWIEEAFNVRVGEMIGRKGLVSPLGDRLRQDFYTGCRLTAVRTRREVVVKEVEVTRFQEGQPYTIVEKRQRPVTRTWIEFRDEDGAVRTAEREKGR